MSPSICYLLGIQNNENDGIYTLIKTFLARVTPPPQLTLPCKVSGPVLSGPETSKVICIKVFPYTPASTCQGGFQTNGVPEIHGKRF